MKKNKLLILLVMLLLTSCGSNVNTDSNVDNDESKGSKYTEDFYLIEPTKDYYQEYESATISYYEPTEEEHIYTEKEFTLNNEEFNEWKNYVFEYVNYGNRQNLMEYGEGASIKYRYHVVFNFNDKHDVYRFTKDDKFMTGRINPDCNYYNNEDPKTSDELIEKRNELVAKIDERLETIEPVKFEFYC